MVDTQNGSLKTLKGLLDEKKCSSVELTQHYLDLSKKHEGLGAYISLLDEYALKNAQAADDARAKGEDRPLLGVPIAIKDVLATKYGKTTCASKILKDYESPYTATVVQKLEEAGAVIFGKTNMDEFAMGSSTENSSMMVTQNPWSKDRVPGGSSGGSAAAVAARIAPAALGTDTGGSIRQPSAFCGVTGIKPTYGRVSRYGLVAYASSFDQIGPIGLDAYDCALLTKILSGKDQNDSTSMDIEVPSFDTDMTSDIKGLRIGIPREYFIDGIQKEISDSIQAAIETYKKLGAEIVDISLPHTEAAIATYYILVPAEASSNLARFDGIRYGYRASDTEDLTDLYCTTRSEGFGTEVKRRILIGTYVLSSGYYDAYYLKAQKVRRLIQNDFLGAFKDHCDVILCPTTPTTAFKLAEKTDDPLAMYLNDIFTIPLNLAGLPGMNIPCGLDSEGLPIGLQLIAGPWQEQNLFNAAHAFQEETDWHTKQPTL